VLLIMGPVCCRAVRASIIMGTPAGPTAIWASRTSPTITLIFELVCFLKTLEFEHSDL
jgi:hypothetical protein